MKVITITPVTHLISAIYRGYITPLVSGRGPPCKICVKVLLPWGFGAWFLSPGWSCTTHFTHFEKNYDSTKRWKCVFEKEKTSDKDKENNNNNNNNFRSKHLFP